MKIEEISRENAGAWSLEYLFIYKEFSTHCPTTMKIINFLFVNEYIGKRLNYLFVSVTVYLSGQWALTGQLKSEWIYEDIKFPK